MALAREHGHCVVEDVASALNALVQPRSSMSLLIDWNRKGLTSAVINCINDGDVEFIRVLRQMMSTRHS
jgi:hypothetical protein